MPDADQPTNPLRMLFAAWNRFWFTPVDPTLLGLIRICAGCVVLYVYLAYSYDLQAFFGADAWLNLPELQEVRRELPMAPRQAHSWREFPDPPKPPYSPQDLQYMERWDSWHPFFATGYYSWSIWFDVTDPLWMRVVHVAVLVNFVLFTIGCGTRITAVIAWLASLSYIQRGFTSLFGMDTMINIVLLYLMIGPSGAALSVDRLLAARRRTRGQRPTRTPPLSVSANMTLRLFQIHLCIIYFIAGLSKLQGNAWWNGTATWGTIANPEFSPVYSEPFVAVLRYLCDHRWLWEICMSSVVVFTLAFEIAFPFVIWNRQLRKAMVLSAVALHLGIALLMGLTGFGLMMLTLVLSFIPPEELRRWLTRIAPPAPSAG